MKKRILLFLIFVLTVSVGYSASYTFKVTVSDSAQVCYITGGFNGWSPSATAMTKTSDSPKVFSVDLEIADKDTVGLEYKYCAGPDWAYQQKQSANFKFSKRTEAGDVAQFSRYYSPTFEADVTIEVLVPSDLFVCYLTGSFNGWNSTSNKMNLTDTSVNGKVFSLMIHSKDTTTLEFKFLAGPGWPYEQTNSANYNYLKDGAVLVCDQFKSIYDPSKVGDITINITVPDLTAEVWVVGSYNGWNMGSSVKATKNVDGTFTAVIPQVADIEYKIWCHNDWSYEEAANADGAGLPSNRVASFETGPVFNITVAYWKKLFRPLPVPPMYRFMVTVSDSAEVCYVTGGFNGWNPSATKMTKVSDNPKVFSIDLEIADKDTIGLEYKYCAGPDWAYQQKQSANFKFSKMTAAGDVASFARFYSATFEADVTIEVLVPSSIFVCYLTGSFNGWNSTSDPMTLIDTSVNGKVFSLNIHSKDTTTLEYKFLAGPGWPYEQKNAANYKYTQDGGTVVCDQFKSIFDPAKVGDITINITVPEGTSEVWVVGSYNGWNMGTSVKATKNADGTYTAVIQQVADIEYKIWCHNDWSYEEAANADGAGLPSNRVASFETGPVFNITVAYWKKLYTSTWAVSPVSDSNYRMYSKDGSIIVEGVKAEVVVYDLLGRVKEHVHTNTTFYSQKLKSGIYIIRADSKSQKIFVK